MDIPISNIKIVTYTAEEKLKFFEEELFYARKRENELNDKIKELMNKINELENRIKEFDN